MAYKFVKAVHHLSFSKSIRPLRVNMEKIQPVWAKNGNKFDHLSSKHPD